MYALLVASTSFAQDDHLIGKHPSKIKAVKNAHLIPGVFQQPIEHSGKTDEETFGQRYWYDSEFASGSNAPVLYHICGEGNAEDGYFLNDNAIEWAKTLGAHLVYLEHRFYGKSIPHGDLATEHLKSLTLNNIIEDLATFQKFIAEKQGFTGKWITLGGSYSGTLSAIYRQLHPELVVGALAASAPMISGLDRDRGSQSDVNSLSYTDASNDSGDRPWVYQSCTTFGFWLTNGMSLFHPSKWLCEKLFGSAPQVNSATYNENYYAPYIVNNAQAPTNILFTYGTSDIWTKLGIAPENNKNPKITIELIKGAGHHYDLNAPTSSDSAAVKHARATFLSLAKEWLK